MVFGAPQSMVERFMPAAPCGSLNGTSSDRQLVWPGMQTVAIATSALPLGVASAGVSMEDSDGCWHRPSGDPLAARLWFFCSGFCDCFLLPETHHVGQAMLVCCRFQHAIVFHLLCLSVFELLLPPLRLSLLQKVPPWTWLWHAVV